MINMPMTQGDLAQRSEEFPVLHWNVKTHLRFLVCVHCMHPLTRDQAFPPTSIRSMRFESEQQNLSAPKVPPQG